MLWIKALHIIFMVTWFAGLFYLPRLFVYHAMATDPDIQSQFKIMEHKLFWFITTPGAILTTVFGIWLVCLYPAGTLNLMLWLQLKFCLVILLWIYHIGCGVLLNQFKLDRNPHSHRWYRLFNEAPTLLLIGIVLLAVLKPGF